MQNDGHLVWMDLEMTGLDPARDTILQIATVITGSDLRIVAEGPCLTIHQPDAVLAAMDGWCVEHHGRSGLTEQVRRSDVTMESAEERTLEFVAKYCPVRTAPLCGNTIGQDRRFLVKYMTRLHDFFHYRSIDVSTIKELAHRWYPPKMHYPPKSDKHEALEDVLESIKELVFYKNAVFK